MFDAGAWRQRYSLHNRISPTSWLVTRNHPTGWWHKGCLASSSDFNTFSYFSLYILSPQKAPLLHLCSWLNSVPRNALVWDFWRQLMLQLPRGVQPLPPSWICWMVSVECVYPDPAWKHLLLLCLCVRLVALFCWKKPHEEQMLIRFFGDEYLDYASRVPCGIPWISEVWQGWAAMAAMAAHLNEWVRPS